MKVDGVDTSKDFVYGPLVFKRGDKKFLAFTAKPCWDLEEFNALCPYPKNLSVMFAKGGKTTDPDCPVYRDALETYFQRRWGYVVMKTLEPSNITWEEVDKDDPTTWVNVVPELKKAVSVYEWGLLSGLINEANSLDADKLEENQKSFFQLQAEALTSPSGPSGVPASSKSSEPVNGLE